MILSRSSPECSLEILHSNSYSYAMNMSKTTTDFAVQQQQQFSNNIIPDQKAKNKSAFNIDSILFLQRPSRG